ncbi:VanZ family protein [Haloimpatiens sp. FM7315]|uniref:VanZ family protein n=1 Tax=Haloimpatiens sp. FM7315 TaxID=3298609 RepID=UPI0035A349F7
MNRYFEPIKIAIITFPFIAALFTLPFMIFQYKKHGYINKIRIGVLYTLLLFFISAYYLVVLPLPKIHSVAAMQKPITEYMQLTPFTFVVDFLKETNVVLNEPKTYLSILKERALLQVVFNVVLLLPFGIYLRYYFRLDVVKTVLVTFLLSLFFKNDYISYVASYSRKI